MSSDAWGTAPEGADSETLLAAIDRALSVATDGLDGENGPQLGRRLAVLEQVQRRLEAATVTVLGEARRSGAWTDDGHRSTAA